MKKIALNYIYLSKNHAGGKDQVGLNLLRGFYENNLITNMVVICFDYSSNIISEIAPGIDIIELKGKDIKSELGRMLMLCYINTVKLPKIIKDNNISMIYHLSCNNGLKKFKIKSIVIPHDIKAVAHRVIGKVKVPFYKYILYYIMYSLDFRHADYIIAISKTDKSEMEKYYSQYSDKIRCIYNPINISRSNNIIDKTDKYICALNLQFHHKNIITLIKAYERIKDKIDHDLILIGSVPKRVNYLKEYVETHNLSNRIKFTGFIDDKKMQEIFIGSSLYINPTLYEGFGMTAIEAMILKIPTLVSKIPTNYEVTKGLCNYYYPPEDEKMLAEEIIKCLNREYVNKNMDKISEDIYNEYNYIKISNDYYNFFLSIV